MTPGQSCNNLLHKFAIGMGLRAVATVKAFTADGLFTGQNDAFFDFAMRLATAADNAKRELKN